MSKELVKKEGTALAVLQGGGVTALQKTIKDLGITQFELQKIGIPTGGGVSWQMQTVEGIKSVDEVQCVIVGVKAGEKAWWADDQITGSPPDCQSHDGQTGIGMNSRGGATGKHECAMCLNNQWGSHRKGGKGKDCKDMMFVFFFRPDSKLPSRFVVPPTSLKPMRQYLLGLASEGMHYSAALTSLKLEGTKNSAGTKMAVVAPTLVRRLDAEEAAKMQALSDAFMTAMVGVEVTAEEVQE